MLLDCLLESDRSCQSGMAEDISALSCLLLVLLQDLGKHQQVPQHPLEPPSACLPRQHHGLLHNRCPHCLAAYHLHLVSLHPVLALAPQLGNLHLHPLLVSKLQHQVKRHQPLASLLHLVRHPFP